jgi:hypothetical protein
MNVPHDKLAVSEEFMYLNPRRNKVGIGHIRPCVYMVLAPVTKDHDVGRAVRVKH